MRARTLLVAAVASVLLVLTGCGGGESPKPKPYTKPTASSLTPPPTPAAIQGADERAAKAFVMYYLKVFAYSSNTGDVSALRKLGRSGCESCAGVISAIKGVYDAGGRSSGVKYTASSVRGQRTSAGWSIYLTLESSSQRMKVNRKSATKRLEPSATKARFDVLHDSSGWIVEEWTRL